MSTTLWNKLVSRHNERLSKQNARKMREDIICMQGCFSDGPENEKIRTLLQQVRAELERRM